MELRFDEPAELEGEFSLPEPAERFYGRVNHEVSGTRLHAVNSRLVPADRMRSAIHHPVVFGELVDGRVASLLGVRPFRWHHVSESRNVIDAFIESVVIGAHVEALDAVPVHGVYATIHGLRECFGGVWPDRGLLGLRKRTGGRGETFSVELAGAQLDVDVGEVHNLNEGEIVPRAHAGAALHFAGETTFRVAEEQFLEPLRDLVLFCTRRPSYITSISLYHEESFLERVRVLRQPHPVPDVRAGQPVRALSPNLRAVSDPHAFVCRWFELPTLVGPVWSLLFSTLQGQASLEDRFLALVAFTEGYHRALHDRPPLTQDVEKQAKKAIMGVLDDVEVRRIVRQALAHANSQTLRERLHELASWATETIGWSLDIEQLCQRTVHTRNWMVHWGTRGAHAVDDAAELVEIAERLELVIFVNLLRDLGLSEAEIALAVGSGWQFTGLP